jgi:hypothetical protein
MTRAIDFYFDFDESFCGFDLFEQLTAYLKNAKIRESRDATEKRV